MIKVTVSWDHLIDGSKYSIELSHWCQQRGLLQDIDYNWQFKPTSRETVFYFKDHRESYATLFMLTWGGHSEV